MLTQTRLLVAIREAAAEDAYVINDVTQAAYAEYAGTDAPSSVTEERAEDLRFALAEGVSHAIVVECDDTVVASVRYQVTPKGLYFFRLGVLPSARGRGIARQMVAYLEEIARAHDLPRMYCRVRMTVETNVRLYESSGFRLIGMEHVRRGITDVPTGTMEKLLN